MIRATFEQFSSKIPMWQLDKGDLYLGFAVPRLFSGNMASRPTFYTPSGMAVFLAFGIHPAELTDTEVYDTAVPINEDHTYPFGGNAITVYKSNDLPAGVVNGVLVRDKAKGNIERAILKCHEAVSND